MKFTQVNTGTDKIILEKVSLDKSWIIGIDKSYEVFWKDLESFNEGTLKVLTIEEARRVLKAIETYFSTLPTLVDWQLVEHALPVYRGDMRKYYREFLELESNLMIESILSDKGD